MTELIAKNKDQSTMTSRELAKVLDRRHDNILRDIAKIDLLILEEIILEDANGRSKKYIVYNLTPAQVYTFICESRYKSKSALMVHGVDGIITALRALKPVETKEKKGFVYVIKCNDFYKIGRTNNVQKRLSGMQTGNPYELELILSIKTNSPFTLETSLHTKFKDKLIRGEWFKLSDKDLKIICKIGETT